MINKAELDALLLKAPEYYKYYISLVGTNEKITDYLKRQQTEFLQWADAQSDFAWTFRYAEGKWSMKEVLGHLLDTERIMQYRALCFARGEEKSLPGFEENEYVLAARFDERKIETMLHEFRTVREATLSLLGNFHVNDWRGEGLANGMKMSVAAIAYMIAGHNRHHWNVLRERYLGENGAL